MNWIVETPAATLAETLTNVKLYCKIKASDTSHDTAITNLIYAAQEAAKSELSISPVAESYVAYVDDFSDIEINFYPIASVDSIKYYNSSNVLTTMVADTDYRIDIKNHPARIEFLNSPALYDRLNPIEVRVTSGYSTVPTLVKAWISSWVKDEFDNAGTDMVGSSVHPFSRTTKHLGYLITKKRDI